MTSGQKTASRWRPPKYSLCRQHGELGHLGISELLPHTRKASSDETLPSSEVDVHRGHQPRPGHHLHPDGPRPARPTEPRGLAQSYGLGTRQPRPAGLRGAALVVEREARSPRPCSPTGCGAPASCRVPAPGREPAGSQGDPVLFLSTTRPGVSTRLRQPGQVLDHAGGAERTAPSRPQTGDPETLRPASAQYEMAYRMQESVPRTHGPRRRARESTYELYGEDARVPGHVRGELPAWPGAWPSAGRALRPGLSTGAGTSTRTCPRQDLPRSSARKRRPGLGAALVARPEGSGVCSTTPW